MSTLSWKLMLAAVLIGCSFGGFAWATPGQDAIATLIAGPVAVDELKIKAQNDTHKIRLQTRGPFQSVVVRFNIAGGGHTGWHSHPGPAFVMVKSGILTLYYADNPNVGVDYPAGTGWVEQPGRVHIAINERGAAVELDAFLLVPLGAPLRIDEPMP